MSRTTMRPTIPIEVALWDYEAIGAYLVRNPERVRTHIATQPGFPKPIRLPTINGTLGQPLFKAREVIAWAESFAEV